MNTPVSSPSTRAFGLSTAKGENHDSSGVSAPPLISATSAKSTSAPTCAKIITRWTDADSSVPITQMAVITAMMMSAKMVTAAFESRRPSRPNMSNV